VYIQEFYFKASRVFIPAVSCALVKGRISLSCNLSLAPGFSPVGAGDAAPSRFNGFVAAGAENG
jgi:hypothetical protein